MTDKRKPGDDFEERLLSHLKHEVAERGAAATRREAEEASTVAPAWRRRAPRLALGGGLALAAAATALIVSAGGDSGSKAFAVEPQAGGGVAIKVFSAEDAAGLEAALAEAGIRSQVTWLPAGMTCREPRYTPSKVRTAMGGVVGGFKVAGPGAAMTIGVMSTAEYREQRQELARLARGETTRTDFEASTPNIVLDPAEFSPDQTVVVSGAPGPSPDLSVVVGGPTEPLQINPEGGYEASFGIAAGPVEPCEPVKVENGGMLGAMNRVLEAEAAAAGAGGGG